MKYGKQFLNSSLFGAFSDPDERIAGPASQAGNASTVFQLQITAI